MITLFNPVASTDLVLANPSPEANVNESLTWIPGPAPRGGLSRMVESLILNSPLTYGQIVMRVRENYPDCRTSTKSVASVARDLKKKGYPVPNRTMSYVPHN